MKRAVSLKKEQDEELQKLSRSEKVSYSALLQAAIDRYLKDKSMMAMEEAYAKYYGSRTEKQKREDDELAEWTWRVTSEAWNDSEKR